MARRGADRAAVGLGQVRRWVPRRCADSAADVATAAAYVSAFRTSECLVPSAAHTGMRLSGSTAWRGTRPRTVRGLSRDTAVCWWRPPPSAQSLDAMLVSPIASAMASQFKKRASQKLDNIAARVGVARPGKVGERFERGVVHYFARPVRVREGEHDVVMLFVATAAPLTASGSLRAGTTCPSSQMDNIASCRARTR